MEGFVASGLREEGQSGRELIITRDPSSSWRSTRGYPSSNLTDQIASHIGVRLATLPAVDTSTINTKIACEKPRAV